MLPWIMFFLIIEPSSKDLIEVLVWIFRVLPSFAFGNGILNISNTELWTRIYF